MQNKTPKNLYGGWHKPKAKLCEVDGSVVRPKPPQRTATPPTISYCDNCGIELSMNERVVFASLNRDVSSANAGESSVLCRDCVETQKD